MKLAILFLGIFLCSQVILAQEAEEGSGAEEAVEESSGLKLYKNSKFGVISNGPFIFENQEMPVMNQSVRMVPEMVPQLRRSVWKEKAAKEVQQEI